MVATPPGLASEAALHRWLRLRPRERGNAPGSLPDSGYQAAGYGDLLRFATFV